MITETFSRLTRRQLQSIVFLLVLPALNWAFVVVTLYDLGVSTPGRAGRAAFRLWLVFGLSFVALRLLRTYAPAMLDNDRFWRQLGVHVLVVVSIAALIGPFFEKPAFVEQQGSMLMPPVFLILEIVVYVAVLWMLRQQEVNFATTDRLREAQLSVLKLQSNPHFLFNTLNLITAEISTDPNRAKETVFDLADLLRSSVKLAEKRLVTVSEDVRLSSLYLDLQQRRFKDRLTVDITMDPRTEDLQIPSLLLQPIVENAIKWAVSPYAGPAHIAIATQLHVDRLSITVSDTGSGFDDDTIVEGDGFRILRRTLDLHYCEDYQLNLRSTEKGGLFSLDLPAIPRGSSDE
ncbi:MAG: histidine kinase [Pseudomonadota bacterium]